jgi:phage-related protein
MSDGLFEVRSNLKGGRIARVLFIVEHDHAVLLHGFIKKSQKTPHRELRTTKIRLADLRARIKDDRPTET